MLSSLISLLEWLVGEIGSAAQRHKERALKFIREASERAAKRRKQ